MPAHVLIVEDDHVYAERIIAPYFQEWRIRMAHNVPQGLKAADEITDLSLAIVDLDIPGGKQDVKISGGAGFEVIKVLKRVSPEARIVILSAHVTAKLINLAQRMQVEYIAKGNCKQNLRQIASNLKERASGSQLPSVRLAMRLSKASNLSEKQREVLILAVRGFNHAEIAQELSITAWTLKSHLKQILRRTRYTRFQDLLRMIIRESQANPI